MIVREYEPPKRTVCSAQGGTSTCCPTMASLEAGRVRVFIRPGWRGATSGVVSSDVRGIDHQR